VGGLRGYLLGMLGWGGVSGMTFWGLRFDGWYGVS
jgi:hypothetical protein